MPVTLDELDSFNRFAPEKMHQGEAIPSLEECPEMWRAEREREETLADVWEGVADMEGGRFSTLEEVDRRIRKELGFAPREP